MIKKPSVNTFTENERAIYGTTLHIGDMDLKTIYGIFRAYVFQDLITKGYVLALVYGDITSPTLYTRMHSSCVTSETMRSLDCDCVKQLNGAFKKIAEMGNGILFYLIQEGRGCGYVGKSRGLMYTQANPELTTFDVYKQMGMKADYRSYHNIGEICHILNISPETKWKLLTNNPDKIKGFTDIGLKIDGIESIVIKSNVFNQDYLFSKKEFGHLLYLEKVKASKYSLPENVVEPFDPYSLPHAKRFVYTSAYYLPIKPVSNQIILSKSEYEELFPSMSPETLKWVKYHRIDSNQYILEVLNKEILVQYPKLLCKPYWFKVNVFYDIASGTDFVVLEYGDVKKEGAKPIVRIHSESLMNRFPLTQRKYKDRFKRVLETIVKHGAGLIVLLYHDGRGAGLGYYVLNQTVEDVSLLGIKPENRDFQGAFLLLKTFVGDNEVRILSGKSSQNHLVDMAKESGIKVCQWNEILTYNKDLGHQSIADRIDLTDVYLQNNIIDNISISNAQFNSKEYFVTGVGSSEAHANHLVYLLNIKTDIKASFVSLVTFFEKPDLKKNVPIIVFSQGLSHNVKKCFEYFEYKNIIVITSVDENHHKTDRIETYKNLKANGSQIIHYNEEIPDNTLIRILGPLSIFVLNLRIIENIKKEKLFNYDDILNYIKDINQKQCDYVSPYVSKLISNDKICFMVGSTLVNFMKNIMNKFLEGAFYPNAYLTDYISFAHGVFQCFQNARYEHKENYVLFLIIDEETDKDMVKKIHEMYPSSEILEYRLKTNKDFHIVELEAFFNQIVFNLIYKLNIDQINWQGKDTQDILYRYF